MAMELFSDEWMNAFLQQWNAEPELAAELSKINFNSVIGYGIPGEPTARGYIAIENGTAVRAGKYADTSIALQWDLRAKEENWRKWMTSSIGAAGLGMAAASGKLKFETGDFGAMFRDPRMAGPFIKSFSVMGRV